MPDRTFCDKSRTMSDIRRVNLGIGAAEFFSIWLPEVKDITDRVLRKQRQFPCVPVEICKRDISNAFNRVPLRPDYCAIFCHQCDAENNKTGADITLAWLAPPLRFSASPAIFAMRTEVIQRTLHSMESDDGSWSGWGQSLSEISAVDAIFGEADIGNIPTEVVE